MDPVITFNYEEVAVSKDGGSYAVEYFIENPGLAQNKVFLGDNEYFVLGDNRNHSTDSRDARLGVVKYSQIYGHAFISRGYCVDNICGIVDSKHDYDVKGW